jgi:hypothetical protein
MALGTPYAGTPYYGRSVQKGASEPHYFDGPLRVSAMNFDAIAPAPAQVIEPIYRDGDFACLDRNGRIRLPWHGQETGEAASTSCFGVFGVLRHQNLSGGPWVKTIDPANGQTLLAPWYDFSGLGLTEDEWTLQGKNATIEREGFNIVVGDGVLMHVLGNPRPGADVYLVDHDRGTTDVADVIHPVVIGRCSALGGKDDRTGNSANTLWWVNLRYQQMPPTPVA